MKKNCNKKSCHCHNDYYSEGDKKVDTSSFFTISLILICGALLVSTLMKNGDSKKKDKIIHDLSVHPLITYYQDIYKTNTISKTNYINSVHNIYVTNEIDVWTPFCDVGALKPAIFGLYKNSLPRIGN